MIMIKRFFVLAFLLIDGVLLFSQTPMVVPLDHNPALRNRAPSMLNHSDFSKVKNSTQADTVSLPFFDDFSYYWQSTKPDRKLWMDDYVYINNSYPIQPRSNGVATFDALDANGNVYQNTASTFAADTLTSCPIDLGVSGLNNVYLSFFYQPQGYGDSPEPGDSLILQFKSPVTKKWRTVWNTPGTALHPFKQVLYRVEGEYMRKGFQFRFVNLVSPEQNKDNPGKKGNSDHWHLDYIRLDKNRSENDTAYFDVAVNAPMQSLIAGYQSIPWNQLQFAASRLKPKVEITYRNNNNIAHLVYRYFTVTDVYRKITDILTPGGAENIDPEEIMTYKQDIFPPFESTLVDSALFEIKGYLGTDQHDRKENDTVRFFQFFKDYFARDDGSPENGYGLIGYNAFGCAVACRYETFKPDSVRAINIYFNPTDNNVTAKYRFKIAVWRDDNGRPGEQVYLSSKEYSPVNFGLFTRFDLEKPVYVTKYYWIGWEQVTSGFLNVGFDLNYNDKGNLWYKTGQNWEQDIFDGTLMIRPVMGKRKDLPTYAEQPATIENIRLTLYPNPASQYVRIELETPVNTTSPVFPDYIIEIYDVTGRLRFRAPFTDESINVSGFEPGLYLVRLMNKKLWLIHTDKLMIIK